MTSQAKAGIITGILGCRVTVTKTDWPKGIPREGVVWGIYATRHKGPSFRVRLLWDGIPRGGGVALKLDEFDLA